MANTFGEGGGSSSGGGANSMWVTKPPSKYVAAPKKKATTTTSQPRRSYSSNNNNQGSYRAPQATSQRYSSAPRPAIGNTRTGNIAPSSPPPAPTPMTPAQWLAQDTAFKSQKLAYNEALADYSTQYTGEQNKYTNEFNANRTKLGTERGQSEKALVDDYAARGLMSSGVYGEALNTFKSDWDSRFADLERAKQAYMGDLLTGKTNFEKEQALALKKAEQDAMNRRADKYGI